MTEPVNLAWHCAEVQKLRDQADELVRLADERLRDRRATKVSHRWVSTVTQNGSVARGDTYIIKKVIHLSNWRGQPHAYCDALRILKDGSESKRLYKVTIRPDELHEE